jgi:hypothetical protein
VFDVLFDHLFIETYGGGEISDAPNIAIDVHLPDEFEASLELGAEIGLEDLYDLGDRNIGRDLYLKVEMVLIDVEGMNVERRIFLRDGVERTDEHIFDVGLEELAAVLRAPDDVVLVLVGTMVEALNSHAAIVARRSAVLRSGPIHPRIRQMMGRP